MAKLIELEEFIYINKLQKKDLAEYLGVSSSMITQYLSGQRPLSAKKIEQILEHPTWNKAPFLADKNRTEEADNSDVIEDDTTQSMAIPMVTDVVLSQRGLDIKHYIEKNGSELQSIDPYTLFEGAEFIVEMFKDSMAPDIMAGDKVILQFLPKDAKLQSGALYFVNSKTYADVVRDVYFDGDTAILKARNKRYGDILLDKSEIIRVANVLGIYRNTFSSSYAQLDELRERKDAQMDKMLDMMKTQSEQQDKLINYITKNK
jgi:SOS-response transcriptional repressor LexA